MQDLGMTPDAILCLDSPYNDPGKTGTTLVIFKNSQFFCWDVVMESMLDGYPRSIAEHWPGLLECFPDSKLRGAVHVPAWGPMIFFLFEGQSQAVVWDIPGRVVQPQRVPVQDLLPSQLTKGDFTPVYARLPDGEHVIFAFRDREYTRWTIGASRPIAEDEGFPRKIEPDWKDGLVLAPRAGVYVDWPSRSTAHSNRKIYFFMGNLYLRWDVPSNTRNYRLDIIAGWKGGWPA